MDIVTGTTLRRNPGYIPRDRVITIGFEIPEKKSTIEIFNNEFMPNVEYSIKKRKRWLISSLLSKDSYDGYQPITYSMVQSQTRCGTKANYIFDSVTNMELGSRSVPHGRKAQGCLNLNSVLTEIVAKDNLKLENSPHNKKSSRYMKKDECFQNDGDQSDRVFFNEFVEINNPLNTKITSYRAYCKIRNISREKKKISLSDVEKEYYFDDNDENDENDDSINDLADTKRPFVMSVNDMIPTTQIKHKSRQRKHNKTKRIFRDRDNLSVFCPNIHEEDSHGELRFMYINQFRETFMDEMKSICEFCHCWISNSTPRLILVNLDCGESLKYKNFIALKPMEINEEKTIRIKVILNFSTINFNKVYDKHFESIRELVEFLLSDLDPENHTRSDNIRELLVLDEPIETIDNTWTTKKIDITKPIFCLTKEWKKYECDLNSLEHLIFNNISTKTRCESCLRDLSTDESRLLNECQHLLCDQCLSCYIYSNQMNLECSDLKCPIDNCQTKLDCISILSLIPFKLYENRLKILEDVFISKSGVSCSHCNSLVIIKDKQVTSTDSHWKYICCCKEILCGSCGGEPHWPSSCEKIKSHDKQLMKLNDLKLKPIKPEIKILTGRFCPKCGDFLEILDNSRSFVLCVCGSWICYYCGGTYRYVSCNSTHIKCQFGPVLNMETKDISKYSPCPEPDSMRSKFYCRSIEIKLSMHPTNLQKLKNKLMKIDWNISKGEYLERDYRSVAEQYGQILRTLECIYISVNQTNVKVDTKLRHMLKNSSNNLKFYLYRFESTIDELDEIFSKRKSTELSKKEIIEKRERINLYLKDAMHFVLKLELLIH